MTKPSRFSRPYGTRNKFPLPIPAINRWAILTASLRDAFFFLPTAHCPLPTVSRHRSLLTLFLLSAFCLLPTAFYLLPTAFSQNQPPISQPQPSPSAVPSPLPSPTPPPN